MSSSDPGEEKKLDNAGNGQNVPTKDEGNAMPTFINNWAPLPSAASATSALNMGSTLNLNLPNFYQGSGGSVISGPPLLGGVMLSGGIPSGNTNSTIPTINSASGRTDYLNMSIHNNNSSAGLTVSQIPQTGSTTNANTHAPEAGQRSHSNSFNGYGYTQHAYSTGHAAPSISNTGGGLAPSAGLASNHIDFMNINSSPPLLSSASSAASGMFLTGLPGKSSDGLGMLNHPNIYSSMHGILPAGSANYTNLSTYRDGSLDPLNSAQASVGMKRPPLTAAQNTNVAAANSAVVNSTNSNAANKRAKAVANRARGASVGANGEGMPGIPAGSSLSQSSPADASGAQLVPQNLSLGASVPSTFDSTVSYNATPNAPGQISAPTQMPSRPLPSTLHTQPAQGTAPAPLTSATITYPIISSYKATSVMTTGGAAYMSAAAPAVSTLHSAQGSVNAQQGSSAVMVGMQSAHGMGGNAAMGSVPQLSGSYVPDSSSPRPYAYASNAGAPGSNMHMPQLQQQQQQQHQQQLSQQPGQGMGYNGSAQGLTYLQQQQQNAYHRQQPMLSNPNAAQGQVGTGTMYGHNSGMAGNTGGQMQMPNYPMNPLSNQHNMNNNMNMLNNSMQNMQNMQNNMQGGMQNSMQNNTAQQNAANKAAPARARVRNKTPRPGKKALAAAAALGGPEGGAGVGAGVGAGIGAGGGGAGDGIAPGILSDTNGQVPAVPAVKPMTYKEKRAASSKKAMAAAAAAAAAEAERTGEPIAPGLVVPADSRRKDGKRDRDNSLVDGEAGRSEREKAEKEESTTALLKRREPIVQRLEDIEDSKFLGRKGPSFVPPAITPVPALSGQVSKMEEEWELPEGAKPASQARGLRDEGRRPKTHWDYVLQEVQWMAVDFRQELRWKVAAAKHTAEACASSSSRCVPSQRAVKLSPADAAQARAAAKTLAQRVKAFWQQLSDKVTSCGGHAEDLCKLLSNDYSSELFPEHESDHVKPESINKLTDKILTLPSIIRSSSTGSSLEEAASTPIEKAKSAYFLANTSAINSCMGSTPITLLAHQQAALQQVNALNAEKFGAVLYGKSYIGKTTTGCELIKEWLTRRDDARSPVVLVVAERRCVFRWATELRSQNSHQVEVWSTTTASAETSAEAKVLVVASELLSSFLSSTRFRDMTSPDTASQTTTMAVEGVEGASVEIRCVLQGVIADRRCVPDTPAVASSSASAGSRALGVLGELAARLDRRLTQRCLIAEDTFLPGSILEALSFLSPGTHVRDWDSKYPAGPNSAEEVTENHQEQIVRNTLNQLLANLSVAVKLPANADSVIAAQTRVEVVAPEMDSAQARLYHTVMSHLARHPTICSGENTTKLAAVLVLLQKVCFHAALVTHKGQGVVPSRYIGAIGGTEPRYDDNIQLRSELDTSEMQLSGGVPGLSTRPSLTNIASPYASSTLPLRTPSSYDLYWAGGSGVRGGTDASAMPSDYVFSESTFSRGVLSTRPAEESAEVLDQGSCKLQGLRRLLRRFAGLRVAVLVETQDECLLVKQLLEVLRIQHEVAFAPTSRKASAKDDSTRGERSTKQSSTQSAEEWVASQKAVQVFNSPLNDTCVLLCSKHVFQPPNVPPQQADAVVILSDDWTCTTEVRDCFRLRLLSAGPTGPPLTVVRVAAGGTIEERMARKGASVLQLQGTPMSQLWPGAKSPLSLTAIPSSLMTGNAEPTLLNKAPVLVLPTAPKSQVNAISPFPGSETDSSRTGSDRSGSPMVLSSESDASKRNSDSSLRGKGKGFIVLGRQGSTTFVKDQGTQGLGLSRGRSGVLPGLNGSNSDPLRQPEAQTWFRKLHGDLLRLVHDFDARTLAVQISTVGDLMLSSETFQPTLLALPGQEEKNQEEESFETQNNARNAKKVDVEDSSLTTKEIEALLGRVFDQFVLSQAAEAAFGADTSTTPRALRNRLLRILEGQFAERISDKRDAPEVSTFDGVPLPLEPVSSFGQVELQRLIASGLGKSAEEDALSHLMLPFQYDSLLPLDSNKIKAEVDASQHWPQSFFVFRDVLAEARRLGVSVDHVLYVSPLQTACRNETISANAFQRNSLPVDATISIKYLAEGARSAAGANRNKSRRSRPSGGSSRRKDSVTSLTNPAENAENANAAPAQSGDGQEVKVQSGGNEATFEGFLSDLEPSGDTPQKITAVPQGQQRLALPVVSPIKSPNPPVLQENTSLDSWHPTEDDIIICTQNAFSDTHFKRTENWLNRALEQSRRRRRTAAEARLRYTWLCTTGRTQQRLQDPLVIAQIEQLRFSVQQRVAAAAAASAANAAAGVVGQGSQPPSPFVAGASSSLLGVEGQMVISAGAIPLVHATPTKSGNTLGQPDVASGAPF